MKRHLNSLGAPSKKATYPRQKHGATVTPVWTNKSLWPSTYSPLSNSMALSLPARMIIWYSRREKDAPLWKENNPLAKNYYSETGVQSDNFLEPW